MSALREQLITEIQRIPDNRLREIFDVIHFFRLGLDSAQTNKQESPVFTKSGKGVKLGGLADKGYRITVLIILLFNLLSASLHAESPVHLSVDPTPKSCGTPKAEKIRPLPPQYQALLQDGQLFFIVSAFVGFGV